MHEGLYETATRCAIADELERDKPIELDDPDQDGEAQEAVAAGS